MTHRHRLLKAHAELTAAIRASETWEKSYTDSPATFKRLVRQEAALQSSANEYMLGLAERAPGFVNWHEVELKPLTASAVPPASDEVWKTELALLTAMLGDHVVELLAIGANAGEYIYARDLGITTLDESILKAAQALTADKVTLINDTTRRNLQLAIKQSISNGDDVDAAIKRIQRLIANPVRAEMIAQTESVNAYQGGLDIFGDQTGVKSWTWDALSGACLLCAPLDGTTKKVGEPFQLPNGKEVFRPAAHTRCRCGRIANYDK